MYPCPSNVCSVSAEEDFESPRTEAMDGVAPRCECWELTLGPLKEELLTTRHFSRPLFSFLRNNWGSTKK